MNTDSNSVCAKASRWMLALLVGLGGCAGPFQHRFNDALWVDEELEHYKSSALEIEYPDVESSSYVERAATPPPITLSNEPIEHWNMSLAEATQTALAHSNVLRDLGGLLLQSPENVQTLHGPAITESNPTFGVDAALSAFDAQFETSMFFENNDRALNNVFFGGGTRELKQDLHSYQAELSKTTGGGGHLALRKIIDYDANNSPGNANPNLPWTVQMEAEFRQPLFQGAGVDFNQIAGPGAAPGALNGVLIARINTDKSLADFEMAVRNLVNDVENAYWELYFAYRDLDSKVDAQNRALESWRNIHALFDTGRLGGEADQEAQAREQYFRLKEEVYAALAGRSQDRIRTSTFRGAGGIHAAERRLRLLLGIPVNDGRLIRPSDEPLMAKVVFHWDEILVEALTRRAELRRQKWQVRRRELELLASRNFLLPQFDAVGRYRFRGLGNSLINPDRQTRFDNAYQDLTTGDFQEWQLGFELTFPVGYRQGNAAVRNAELLLARDRDILEAQEQDVVHDLSSAYAEIESSYLMSQTNYNRVRAASDRLAALEAKYEGAEQQDKTRLLDLLLDAQRRYADAESEYFRALIEYTLAVKNVHFQKGSLLEYNEVFLAEGPWPGKAYRDAEVRDASRRRPWKLMDYVISRPRPLSTGTFHQRIHPGDLPVPGGDGSTVEEIFDAPTRAAESAGRPRASRASTNEPMEEPWAVYDSEGILPQRLLRSPAGDAPVQNQLPQPVGPSPVTRGMTVQQREPPRLLRDAVWAGEPRGSQAVVIDRSETMPAAAQFSTARFPAARLSSARPAGLPPKLPPATPRDGRPRDAGVRWAAHHSADLPTGAGQADRSRSLSESKLGPDGRWRVPAEQPMQSGLPRTLAKPTGGSGFSPWSDNEWR